MNQSTIFTIHYRGIYKPKKSTYRFWGILPFLSVHLMCFYAFWVGISLDLVLLAVASYYLRMFGVTAGYHRYFSHCSFKTGRVFQFILACLAMTSAQKGVLWWAAVHRHHHKYSDLEEDVHSPARSGFWYSQVGWLLSEKYLKTDFSLVKDYAKYPELRMLNRYHLVPPFAYAALIYVLWGFPGLVWGFFISTVILYHCTFFINSLTHMVGRIRYDTRDESKNSFLLGVLCCGEGWHNNHHHYQSAVNQGWFWWEVDFSYYILKIISWFGIVWDLRTPPNHVKTNTIARANLKENNRKFNVG